MLNANQERPTTRHGNFHQNIRSLSLMTHFIQVFLESHSPDTQQTHLFSGGSTHSVTCQEVPDQPTCHRNSVHLFSSGAPHVSGDFTETRARCKPKLKSKGINGSNCSSRLLLAARDAPCLHHPPREMLMLTRRTST